jgi:hypothetical protein
MEIPASFNLAGWLGCAAFAIWMLLLILKLGDRIRGEKANPPNEQLGQSHQHLRADFDKHENEDRREHENIFKKLGGIERGVEERLTAKLTLMANEDKASRGKMHDQITDLNAKVSALDERSDLINQRTVQIDGKIDRLIERKNH